MAKKVGIPRGLFYYQYYPLWKTFLEELGAEIVVSDYTNKKIFEDGMKTCVDEACLPVKLYHGHVLNLKGRVDYLFMPRFTSISRGEYICPKFGGLPDMVRHTIPGLPEIINTEVNLRKNKKNSLKAALEVGGYFSDSKKEITCAFKRAIKSYSDFREKIKKGILPNEILTKKKDTLYKLKGQMINIAVIGHVYNLYDNYVNMDLILKLKANHVNVFTVDMLDGKEINEKSDVLKKKIFWNFGRKAIDSAYHILERDDIDGIIYIMSFGCGVDSFVCDLVERRIRNNGDIPFMVLTLDEHSGEAGLNTRIEAFIDMIHWRNKDETDISTHG